MRSSQNCGAQAAAAFWAPAFVRNCLISCKRSIPASCRLILFSWAPSREPSYRAWAPQRAAAPFQPEYSLRFECVYDDNSLPIKHAPDQGREPMRDGLSGRKENKRKINESRLSRRAVLIVDRISSGFHPWAVKNSGPFAGANFNCGTSSPSWVFFCNMRSRPGDAMSRSQR
jgi:hypothetical protein